MGYHKRTKTLTPPLHPRPRSLRTQHLILPYIIPHKLLANYTPTQQGQKNTSSMGKDNCQPLPLWPQHHHNKAKKRQSCQKGASWWPVSERWPTRTVKTQTTPSTTDQKPCRRLLKAARPTNKTTNIKQGWKPWAPSPKPRKKNIWTKNALKDVKTGFSSEFKRIAGTNQSIQKKSGPARRHREQCKGKIQAGGPHHQKKIAGGECGNHPCNDAHNESTIGKKYAMPGKINTKTRINKPKKTQKTSKTHKNSWEWLYLSLHPGSLKTWPQG